MVNWQLGKLGTVLFFAKKRTVPNFANFMSGLIAIILINVIINKEKEVKDELNGRYKKNRFS